MKAEELLSDGEWRDREWLLRQLFPLVPPGRALRAAEKDRKRQSGRDERLIQRSLEYQIYVGRRITITNTFSHWARLERKVEDGKRWVRLRPVQSGHD